MSLRLRELATGVASCALLSSAGCRRPPADIGVTPGEGEAPEPEAAQDCPTPATPVAAPGSADDREAPRILAARFVTGDHLRLSFSEPLAPVDAVNPRQFRLSMAYSMVDYEGSYAHAYYYDLGIDAPETPLVINALAADPNQPEVLHLSLSRPVPEEACAEVVDMQQEFEAVDPEGPTERGRVGVFLHYTERGSVGVRDLANNPLEDIGGDWALHYGGLRKQVYGSDPVARLDLLVEIECPEEGVILSAPAGPS